MPRSRPAACTRSSTSFRGRLGPGELSDAAARRLSPYLSCTIARIVVVVVMAMVVPPGVLDLGACAGSRSPQRRWPFVLSTANVSYFVRNCYGPGVEKSVRDSDPPRGRQRLSRERVLNAAVGVADAGGLGALTIRSLAQELGAKPMSVYYHVAGKEEILDGIVDVVFGEIDLPSPGGDWRSETAPARRVGPSGAAAASLGDRVDGVPDRPGPGDAAPPRRGPRHPARGGLLAGDDRARLRPDRQLHLRLRTPGSRPPVRRPRHRGAGRGVDHGALHRRRLPPPRRDGHRLLLQIHATTSPTNSTSASTSSSTPSAHPYRQHKGSDAGSGDLHG